MILNGLLWKRTEIILSFLRLYPSSAFRTLLLAVMAIPFLYNEKDIFLGVSVLKGFVGLHKTVQLQLLQRYWLGHRLG